MATPESSELAAHRRGRMSDVMRRDWLERLGVRLQFCLQDFSQAEPFALQQPNRPAAAASLAKLAIARYAIGHYASGSLISWRADQRVEGGGAFDQPDAPQTASVEMLLEDMLTYGRSGNTAAKALIGPNNVRLFNSWLSGEGYLDTGLQPVMVRGEEWFTTGATTPRESLSLLYDLVQQGHSDNKLAKVASDALRMPAHPDGAYELWLKTGELDLESERDVGVRHDVGFVRTGDGQEIGFSVMMSTLQPFGLRVAQRARRAIQAELIEIAGGLPATALGRLAVRMRGKSGIVEPKRD